MKIPTASSTVRVAYEALGGVDLSTQSRYVSPSRSPRMCNMYKAYADGYSDFLETRPGRRLVHDFGATVHGLYALDGQTYVHAGDGLYDLLGDRRGRLADADSCGFVYDGALWLLDGQDYYRFDGQSLTVVEGRVPITTIGRAPTGGGTLYQPVNLLTNKRINSFRGDGSSTVYVLDAIGIAAVESVTVDGKTVTDFGVDLGTGTVTFTVAPAAAVGGDDNVLITYRARTDGRAGMVGNTRACVFDNRVFVAGGEKGLLRHSRLDDPTYFADTDWYREGECDVTALVVGEGCLYAFTEQGVCRHEPAIDYELGRIYPTVPLSVTVGCVGDAAAFVDDIVWRSPRGVEGLANGFGHRSTLIDSDLCLRRPGQMAVWGSYLCLLTDGRLYLADGRAPYRADGRREYEWFVWACDIDAIYGGESLYWVKDGRLGVFDGSDDEGQAIESYFETRAECVGDPALRKKVGRSGAVALLKKIANADVTVSTMVDGGRPKELCTFHLGGLDFNALDFTTLSFTTDDQDLVRLPLRVKDFLTLSLRFASRKRFGVAAVRYHAGIIRYVK